MKKVFLLSLILSTPAFAGGTWTNVTVTSISSCAASSGAPCSVGTPGYVQAKFSANDTGGASCGSANKIYGEVDVSTNAGQFLASTLQEAYLGGYTVTVYGTGSCSIVSTIETMGQVVQ